MLHGQQNIKISVQLLALFTLLTVTCTVPQQCTHNELLRFQCNSGYTNTPKSVTLYTHCVSQD